MPFPGTPPSGGRDPRGRAAYIAIEQMVSAGNDRAIREVVDRHSF